jgi:hypothetical protein
MIMEQARYNLLMSINGGSLTEEEINQGWHFCPEWDYLLINSENVEGESCTCDRKENK